MGPPWTALRGTWGISSNQAYLASGSSGALNMVAADVGEGNGVIQANVPNVLSTNGGLAIMFRATDANNQYLADFGSSTPQLFKGVAGTYTSLGTFSGGLLANGDTISVTFYGSNITCRRMRGGTWSTLLSLADTTWPSSLTKHGLYIFSLDSTSRIDNFSFVNGVILG
jgi:hypothetical protein